MEKTGFDYNAMKSKTAFLLNSFLAHLSLTNRSYFTPNLFRNKNVEFPDSKCPNGSVITLTSEQRVRFRLRD